MPLPAAPARHQRRRGRRRCRARCTPWCSAPLCGADVLQRQKRDDHYRAQLLDSHGECVSHVHRGEAAGRQAGGGPQGSGQQGAAACTAARVASPRAFLNAPLPSGPFVTCAQGEWGTFQPNRETQVPLWLAHTLWKRKRCAIKAPAWMDAEHLDAVLGLERQDASAFQVCVCGGGWKQGAGAGAGAPCLLSQCLSTRLPSMPLCRQPPACPPPHPSASPPPLCRSRCPSTTSRWPTSCSPLGRTATCRRRCLETTWRGWVARVGGAGGWHGWPPLGDGVEAASRRLCALWRGRRGLVGLVHEARTAKVLSG